MVLQCVVNVAGDILLLKGFGLGLPGAAWATVAAQFLGALALLAALYLPGRVCPPPAPPLFHKQGRKTEKTGPGSCLGEVKDALFGQGLSKGRTKRVITVEVSLQVCMAARITISPGYLF